MNHWGFNWETVGEIMRFFLHCAAIGVVAVMVVRILRYASRIFEERIRWWK